MRWLLTLLLIIQAAEADQTDTSLPDLFSLLSTTTGEQNLEAQDAIWQAWFKVPAGADQGLFDRARLMLSRGELLGAMPIFQQLVIDYPEFAEAYNQLAIIHYARGDDAASISAIYEVLSLEPKHFGAWAGLAQIQLRQGEFLGAKAAAEAALGVNPFMPFMEQIIEIAGREIAKESA